MSTYVLPFTIQAGALPPNRKYTPQQFLDALPASLSIVSQQEFATFTTGAVDPAVNTGPFLKDGVTWRVWSDVLGAYTGQVLDQESLRYFVGSTTPNQLVYDIWFKLDANGNPQGIFKYLNGAWVDFYSSIFYSKAEIDAMVAAVNADISSVLPTGVIVPFGGSTPPTDWLYCNGAAVSRGTYATLFSVIGVTFGIGDGTTTFNVPDLRGRAPVGTGLGDASDATAWGLANKRGAEQHLLTTSEMPAHTHTTSGQHGAGGEGGGDNADYYDAAQAPLDTRSWPATGSTGGGTAHNNVQPSLGLTMMIKFT